MTLSRLSLAVLNVAASTVAGAQLPVVVVDPGPGPTGQVLREMVASSATHLVLALDGTTAALPRDSVVPGSLLIVATRATIAGHVTGDVVLVGGDLFVHPGAVISGRAMAIGGGVYSSALALVEGRTVSHRDFTYDASRAGGVVELRYRSLRRSYGSGPISFPGIAGFRVPSYDRSNGLSLPYGPALALGNVELHPTITYRSQLGAVDPALDVNWQLARFTRVVAFAGRSTLSNDRWIVSDMMNSLRTIGIGHDARNWYRAEHASVKLHHLWRGPSGTGEPYAGFRRERAWSVRPDSFPTGGPWSFFGRSSPGGMLRPNPPVEPGSIVSLLGGAHLTWDVGAIKSFLDIDIESPLVAPRDVRFVQATVDGQITFPALWSHRFRADLHAVVTLGDTAPPQRWAYLGRAGTISTLDLLEVGGDQLVLLESRYEMPYPALKIPFVGPPTVMLRHVIGNAGPGDLPALFELVGARLALSFVRAEVMVDTRVRRPRFVVSLATTR